MVREPSAIIMPQLGVGGFTPRPMNVITSYSIHYTKLYDDSRKLLDLLIQFKKEGLTSIIISHKLNEIEYVADKITIIRDGSTIETLDKTVDDISESRIIKGMVGRT